MIPDRLKNVLKKKDRSNFYQSDWETAVNEIGNKLKEKKGKVYIVSDLQTGALAEVIKSFEESFDSPPPLFMKLLIMNL